MTEAKEAKGTKEAKATKKPNIFTPRKTVGFFFVSFISLTIACMILWPLLDILFNKIFGGEYEGWSWINGILEPVIFALVCTGIEFIFWNAFHKEK